MPRSHYFFAGFLPLLVLATTSTACLWDYDTVRDEKRGLPGIGEVIAGRFEKHSRFYYEQRIARMKVRLGSDPKNLDAWDNLAVAYEKLYDHDKAIETILQKDKISPGQYTTYANLGTFYLHKRDFENGIAAIRKALEINPNAHFGREEYQLKIALYFRDAQKNPEILTQMNFLEYAGALPAMPTTAPAGALPVELEYLQEMELTKRTWRGSPIALQESGVKENAFDGIVGIMRFGSGNPELYLTLGDLLALRGDRNLAYRAYHRALELNHPRQKYLQRMMTGMRDHIYHKEEISDEKIASERDDADAWVQAYQDFEDDLVRRGVDTEVPRNYDPFYARLGPPIATPTWAEKSSDWFRHHFTTVVVAGVVVLPLVMILLVRRLRNKKTARPLKRGRS